MYFFFPDFSIKNFVPHCPEALRYAKVWGRDILLNLTLAYAKRLFPDFLISLSSNKNGAVHRT